MITLQDLIDRFGNDELAELTDPDRHDVTDAAVVNIAIKDAVGVAAGYLNAVGLVKRNSTGALVYISADVPDDLILNICNMARYNLHKDGASATIKERYDSAVLWLKDVKKDPTMLTGPVASATANEQSAHVIPNAVPSYWGM